MRSKCSVKMSHGRPTPIEVSRLLPPSRDAYSSIGSPFSRLERSTSVGNEGQECHRDKTPFHWDAAADCVPLDRFCDSHGPYLVGETMRNATRCREMMRVRIVATQGVLAQS